MFVLIIANESHIRAFTKSQLEYIPKKILIDQYSSDIKAIFHKLPTHLQEDEDIKEYLPCYLHYNRPNDRCHIDGPAPACKDCIVCLKLKKKTEKELSTV